MPVCYSHTDPEGWSGCVYPAHNTVYENSPCIFQLPICVSFVSPLPTLYRWWFLLYLFSISCFSNLLIRCWILPSSKIESSLSGAIHPQRITASLSISSDVYHFQSCPCIKVLLNLNTVQMATNGIPAVCYIKEDGWNLHFFVALLL